MKRVFPEKDEKELKRLSRRFYRHLADIFVESFKNFSITEKQATARMVSKNEEIFQELADKGQGVVLTGGHFNNWELWAVAGALHIPTRLMAIYKRISNPFFDEKMRSSRGKFGLEMVPTKESSQWMKEATKEGPVTAVYAIDQSPANPRKSLWIDFFGHKTATYYGPEKHAKTYNMAVVFGHIDKLKRGHYQIRYELITDTPNELGYGEIMKMVSAKLEDDIRANPEYWIWSHKRWKHAYKEEYEQQASPTT